MDDNRLTASAKSILDRALELAGRLGSKYVGSEHILLAMLITEGSTAGRVLTSQGITYPAVRKIAATFENGRLNLALTATNLSPVARAIIGGAGVISEQSGHLLTGSDHLLLSMLEQKDCVAVKILSSLNLSPSEIKSALRGLEASAQKQENPRKSKGQSMIGKFGKNLCSYAAHGKLDPVVGREKEIKRVIGILCRRTKNNPCLVGEPGVGKTAIVEGLAAAIVKKQVPPELWSKEIYSVELSSMIAGAKYRGDFEERMKGVIDEARSNPDVILFIDEIHTLMGAGSAEGAMDGANIIKPALARAEIQVIGATTYKEYQRHIEKDAALERRFQAVTVAEPDAKGATEMLLGLVDRYESHHGVMITREAIDAAVELSIGYLPDKFLPDKAIDLIDEACANKRLELGGMRKGVEERVDGLEARKEAAVLMGDFQTAMELTEKQGELISGENGEARTPTSIGYGDIARVVTERTGVPVLGDDGNLKLKTLEERLKKEIIGQDEVIFRLVSCIKRRQMVMKEQACPIGSFLFMGESGVGKTALAVALANNMFVGEGALCRFDMSEFTEKHSVSRLIGAPPGYQGFDDGGALISHVRKHPYCVVLFDSIEKAHPDVLALLLQILDGGRLTDSRGRVASFFGTVVILTARVNKNGVSRAVSGFADSKEDKKASATKLAEGCLPSELLNRIDEILVFNPLSNGDIFAIIEKELEALCKSSLPLKVNIHYSPEVVWLIAKDCQEQGKGAREVKRRVRRLVWDKIAWFMAEGNNSQTKGIRLDVADGEIVVKQEENSTDSHPSKKVLENFTIE